MALSVVKWDCSQGLSYKNLNVGLYKNLIVGLRFKAQPSKLMGQSLGKVFISAQAGPKCLDQSQCRTRTKPWSECGYIILRRAWYRDPNYTHKLLLLGKKVK